jgi:hypothetical protein
MAKPHLPATGDGRTRTHRASRPHYDAATSRIGSTYRHHASRGGSNQADLLWQTPDLIAIFNGITTILRLSIWFFPLGGPERGRPSPFASTRQRRWSEAACSARDFPDHADLFPCKRPFNSLIPRFGEFGENALNDQIFLGKTPVCQVISGRLPVYSLFRREFHQRRVRTRLRPPPLCRVEPQAAAVTRHWAGSKVVLCGETARDLRSERRAPPALSSVRDRTARGGLLA